MESADSSSEEYVFLPSCREVTSVDASVDTSVDTSVETHVPLDDKLPPPLWKADVTNRLKATLAFPYPFLVHPLDICAAFERMFEGVSTVEEVWLPDINEIEIKGVYTDSDYKLRRDSALEQLQSEDNENKGISPARARLHQVQLLLPVCIHFESLECTFLLIYNSTGPRYDSLYWYNETATFWRPALEQILADAEGLVLSPMLTKLYRAAPHLGTGDFFKAFKAAPSPQAMALQLEKLSNAEGFRHVSQARLGDYSQVDEAHNKVTDDVVICDAAK